MILKGLGKGFLVGLVLGAGILLVAGYLVIHSLTSKVDRAESGAQDAVDKARQKVEDVRSDKQVDDAQRKLDEAKRKAEQQLPK